MKGGEVLKKKSDYKGFVLHVEEWDKKCIAYGINDLIDLAHRYHTPIPKMCRQKKALFMVVC